MGTNFNAINRSASFNPTGPFPLDKRAYFEGKSAADAAVASALEAATSSKTSNYYIGQLITVKESTGTHVYQIGTDKKLHELDKVSDRETAITTAINGLDSNSEEIAEGSFLTRISIENGKITSCTTGNNASTASKWETSRTITVSGDLVGSATIDGSADITIEATVTDDSHSHIISNIDDLQTSLDGKALKPVTATANKDRPLILGGNANNDSWDSTTLYYANTTSSTSNKIMGNPGTGTITAAKFNATSDARLKENFKPLNAERSILDLPIYKFDFINGNKNQIGCKAQDLREICPEIVNEGEDGYLSIQESKIVYLLLEEVKKLRKEIDELKGV